jgi:SAM-dependent methyltransferase
MSFSDPQFVAIYEQIDGERTIDLGFYSKIAREAKGKVLEAGCGSGRVLLSLAKEGISIEGFDPSQPMLDVLQQRATGSGLEPKVWKGDFDSINDRYAAIISPFNSIMHLLDQQSQIEAIRKVYDSLEPGGVFAFDIVNPHTLDIYDETREFESSMTDARTNETIEIWRWFEHNPISQVGHYHREFITAKQTLHSVIDFRWSYPSEISLLLKMAGFASCEVFGGFDGEELDAESTSQVWIARK